MKKRIEKLEKSMPDDSLSNLRRLFDRWRDGEDVQSELKHIFKLHPEWKHNPPGSIGKMVYINWKSFSGHNIVYRGEHGITGNCECGYYPPKKE